ncbi:MAG: NAD(P)-binding domain-containing protein, partial [Fulvivirga sp.]|nr:NAD(P)-binding domain-containing protein [Fulvivirga sp.]
MSEKNELGLVGLGVMGRNLLMNMADNGFAVIGLDIDETQVNALRKENRDLALEVTSNLHDFIQSLLKPRKIMLMIPAGVAIDQMIDKLVPLLDKGDLVIDGGNSFFKDTNRRAAALKNKNILYLGIGVSGGAKGARFGPSLMVGGSPEAYKSMQPLLRAIAAESEGGKCVAYLGKGSAGHYVKMVHNGIEYALMELIAEAYHLMNLGLNMSNSLLSDTFKKWNNGTLNSYLLEITSAIFTEKDTESNGALIDKIMDSSSQKGTGIWTSIEALEQNV